MPRAPVVHPHKPTGSQHQLTSAESPAARDDNMAIARLGLLLVVVACGTAGQAAFADELHAHSTTGHSARRLQQNDVAAVPAAGAASSALAALPQPQWAAALGAAVALSPELDPEYPNITVQQAEEAQALTALVQAAGGRPVRCSTTATPRQVQSTELRLRRWRVARAAAAQRGVVSAAAVTADNPATVLTYFHVFSGTDGTCAVTDDRINEQMSVLNTAYAGTGFVFQKVDIIRYVNVTAPYLAAGQNSVAELANKARRQGGPDILNVYIWNCPNGLLGWATFPSNYATSAANRQRDGVVVHCGSLPGGNFAPYNLGDTLVHEVGHWLGLFHTFQGGCATSSTTGGDRVSDTPAARTATYGCPSNKNTCTGTRFPGNDPVANYMDYSDDSCMNSFTPGQAKRMRDQWGAFRSPSTRMTGR